MMHNISDRGTGAYRNRLTEPCPSLGISAYTHTRYRPHFHSLFIPQPASGAISEQPGLRRDTARVGATGAQPLIYSPRLLFTSNSPPFPLFFSFLSFPSTIYRKQIVFNKRTE